MSQPQVKSRKRERTPPIPANELLDMDMRDQAAAWSLLGKVIDLLPAAEVVFSPDVHKSLSDAMGPSEAYFRSLLAIHKPPSICISEGGTTVVHRTYERALAEMKADLFYVVSEIIQIAARRKALKEMLDRVEKDFDLDLSVERRRMQQEQAPSVQQPPPPKEVCPESPPADS
jgi:hypothetical protein